MDNLEKFVRQNRRAFDSEKPSPQVWERLSDDLAAESSVKMIPITRLWWVAASFSLVLLSVVAFFVLREQGTNQDRVAQEELSLENLSPELAEAEHYYEQVIYLKSKSLEAYDLEKMEWPSDAKTELIELRQEYEGLKEQLLTEGNIEQITRAMLENLRTRMEILSRELELLEKYQKQLEQPLTNPSHEYDA